METVQLRKSIQKLLVFVLLFLFSRVVLAGTTAPSTSEGFVGTLGSNGWYKSSVDITLTATDTESGVQNTTYWMNADLPTIEEYSTTYGTQFSNKSMENGSIDNWYSGTVGATYFQSSTVSLDGSKSAAVAFLSGGGTFYFWHNESNAIELTVGEYVQISAWGRPFMFPGDAAYIEVWGQDSDGNGDQLIITSNQLVGTDTTWQHATAAFTVPSGKNYIYVKLGGEGSPAAVLYWDQVEVFDPGASPEEVTFNHAVEGVHTLHFYSKDNNHNTETEDTAALKIDTVSPNPWINFSVWRGSCAHCYESRVETRDQTSGIDISTAEYRRYTMHLGEEWGSWTAVDEVNVVSTGNPAIDGETTYVELLSGEIDFGDSAHTPFRLQFRICDMAGNCPDSAVYDLSEAWMMTTDGAVYIEGDISLKVPPTTDHNVYADTVAGTGITLIDSDTNWLDGSYTHANSQDTSLPDLLPNYAGVKANATDMTGQNMPTASGVYIVSGDYDLNATTLVNGYKNTAMSVVLIVEGNLTIAKEFTVVAGNNTVFLVEGNISVTDKNAEEIWGFYVCEGTFNSDSTSTSGKPLLTYGSVIAMTGFSFPRDLGTGGVDDNMNTASEKFIWQPDFLLDNTLVGYLNNSPNDYIWNEIDQP